MHSYIFAHFHNHLHIFILYISSTCLWNINLVFHKQGIMKHVICWPTSSLTVYKNDMTLFKILLDESTWLIQHLQMLLRLWSNINLWCTSPTYPSRPQQKHLFTSWLETFVRYWKQEIFSCDSNLRYYETCRVPTQTHTTDLYNLLLVQENKHMFWWRIGI